MYDLDNTTGNLPDANSILDSVILILEYMNTQEMIKLRNLNKMVFESTMENKFQDFAMRYYSVFKMIMSGDDITPLFEMLKVIDNVNIGKISYENGEHNIGQYLNKFLPPDLLAKIEKGEFTEEYIKKSTK